jgi:hypothetical protein
MSKDNLGKIWDMQEQLNDSTLQKNGYILEMGDVKKPLTISDFRLITEKLGPKAYTKAGLVHWWVQQYTLAALMEVQEYEAELTTDLIKRELELIDILHFIVSMYQVSGISRDGFLESVTPIMEDTFHVSDSGFGLPAEAYVRKLRDSLFGVIKALPWKHWSKKVDFNIGEVRVLIEQSMTLWARACWHEGLSADRILHLYVEKNKVNLARQDSGTYSETTKKPDEEHIK